MPHVARAIRIALTSIARRLAETSPEAGAPAGAGDGGPSRRLLVATAIATIGLSR